LTGTAFTTNTLFAVSATTNQLRLGTTNTVTLTSPAPAASRTYTIPDAGGAANFIMSTFGSVQTIAGGLTSSGAFTASNGLTLTTGALALTSTSGTISLTGTSFTTNSLITVSATTNQFVLGTTNTTTLTAPAPAASRTYTIPDAGGAASFVMTAGVQTIAGAKTFSSVITGSNGLTISSGSSDVQNLTASGVIIANAGITSSEIKYISETGQTTLTSSSNTLQKYTSSGNTSVALPASSSNEGVSFIFVNTGSGNVTITANGADNFDGNVLITSIILNQNDRMHIICVGTSWYTF
jgi:hypothetical protein